jgi:hypothetical protein
MQLMGDAAAAAFVLMIAIGLSVFKPRGRTSFGDQPLEGPAERTPMFYAFWATMVALIVAVVVRHFAGGMPHQ